MQSNLTWSFGQANAQLPPHLDSSEHGFQKIKSEIHQQLVESLDLSKVSHIGQDQLSKHVRALADKAIKTRNESSVGVDRDRLIDEVMQEVFGLGPLEKLFGDPEITDILVNDAYTVYVERRGRLELTDIVFADDAHLIRIIQRIAARLGRRIDEVSPMVDARLPDGSRVNAVIPPLALDGPSLSIRLFGAKPLEIDDLLRHGSIVPEMVDFLAAAIEARIGCVISGGTGAGKTTLLNALSAFIPPEERLVTIEDSAELILQHRHRVRMETRPPNTEGSGEVSQRDLVRNALRMRPDRILVGEVRGAEVWDMLQAMNTGHEGSMTTVHANSSDDALARIEMMVCMTGFDLPIHVIRQYVAAGIKLIVHLARLKGGPRRVMQVVEIAQVKNGDYVLNEIFGYRQLGVNEDGIATGEFYATGNNPTLLARFESAGIELPENLFEQRQLKPRADAAEEQQVTDPTDANNDDGVDGGNGEQSGD